MLINLDLEGLLRPDRDIAPVVSNTGVTNPTEPDVEQSSKRTAQDKRKDRCAVLRPESVDDITGGSSSQYTRVGGYSCAVYETGKSVEESDGLVIVSNAPYIICLPPEADIRPNDLIGVPGYFNGFKPNFNYAVGDRVVPLNIGGNGHFYEVINPGISGGTEPKWPVNKGQVVASGGVIFKEMGDADYYSVVGSNDGMTRQDELVVDATKVSY